MALITIKFLLFLSSTIFLVRSSRGERERTRVERDTEKDRYDVVFLYVERWNTKKKVSNIYTAVWSWLSFSASVFYSLYLAVSFLLSLSLCLSPQFWTAKVDLDWKCVAEECFMSMGFLTWLIIDRALINLIIYFHFSGTQLGRTYTSLCLVHVERHCFGLMPDSFSTCCCAVNKLAFIHQSGI